MKTKLLLLTLLTTALSFAQIPTDYYSSATATGFTLKTQLYNIIKDHTVKTYGELYTTYQTSDRDYYYENDGTVLDMYSEKPSSTDPYNYDSGSTQRCGNYSAEGDCYNREHIIPQSIFNSASPMVSDAHFIVPTDGKVNGVRSNYPHGTVATTSYTSLNGSKLGSSAIAGYTGDIFEPIDEFKGDIARMYFYFVTRYENNVANYGAYAMFNGTSNQAFTTDFLNMLVKWSANDPVNQREIDRNDAVYAQQGNRNPFIDHPEYVQQIWNATPDIEAPTAPTNLVVSTTTATTITLTWTAATDDNAVTNYDVYVNDTYKYSEVTTTATITNLSPETKYTFYIIAKDAAINSSEPSNIVEATTTALIADTEPPSTPTNLTVTASTSTSLTLNWTAATDNQAITSYEVYVNNSFAVTTTAATATLTNLSPSTVYTIYVIAKDAAGNSSTSSALLSTSTPQTTEVRDLCGDENFENMPASNSSYTERSWTNNNIIWTATDARTDQSLNNRAIAIRTGTLTSSAVENGIQDLTVTTQLVFSGSEGTFTLRVNGEAVGTIPYSATATTTTISGLDTTGDVIISFTDNNSTKNRVLFDDLSWSCFTGSAAAEDFDATTLTVYPNPVNDVLYIQNNSVPFSASVFTLLGQQIQQKESADGSTMEIKNLKKGIYMIKITEGKKTVLKKIIVN